jgi:hypothetical protein
MVNGEPPTRRPPSTLLISPLLPGVEPRTLFWIGSAAHAEDPRESPGLMDEIRPGGFLVDRSVVSDVIHD